MTMDTHANLEKDRSADADREQSTSVSERLIDELGFASAGKQQGKNASSEDWADSTARTFLPPYILEEAAKRNPNDTGLWTTYKRTVEMMDEQLKGSFAPRALSDGRASREVYDAEGSNSLPGNLARTETSGRSGDAEVDRVFEFSGIVRDFYKNVFDRNSIDGRGMKMVSTINFRQDENKAFENAFWNGTQMVYGRPDAASPFKTFILLDVSAHEIAHGVTQSMADFKYYGQSGALNESMSDVFGSLVKQYAKQQTADKADWLIGNGIWKDNVNGRALRDMLNPGTAFDDPRIGKDPQPGHMDKYVKTSGDSGGVHYNSGIPNRAFALFAKAVGGYAWEAPGKIWYEAIQRSGSRPSFSSFAYETIEAAKALGQQDKVDTLRRAWAAVGVAPERNALDTITPNRRVIDDMEHSHSHSHTHEHAALRVA